MKNKQIIKIWLIVGFFIVIFREKLFNFLYERNEKNLNYLDLFFFLKIDHFLYDFLKKYFINLNFIHKKNLKKLLEDDFIL